MYYSCNPLALFLVRSWSVSRNADRLSIWCPKMANQS